MELLSSIAEIIRNLLIFVAVTTALLVALSSWLFRRCPTATRLNASWRG
jgi:hypothetical protein